MSVVESSPLEPSRGTGQGSSSTLVDGAWHRLHPATPFLRGGLGVLAVLAVLIANLREQLVSFLFPEEFCDGDRDVCFPDDPLAELANSGNLVPVLLGAVVVLAVVVVAFWLSWRMHAFRITDDVLEVKSGILFRTHRQGRLDRIQGINVTRPVLARIFGVARLEVTVAGQDANIPLAYLGGATADSLRETVLRLASGARPALAEHDAARGPDADATGIIDRRIREFTAPELDPRLVAPASVVRMSLGRLIASTLLSGALVWLLASLAVAAWIIGSATAGIDAWVAVPVLIGSLLPGVIAAASYMISRVVRSLRFSIAGTPDGLRVGYGLLSTTNETLPPGRIHSLAVSQPLLWRPFDWWEVKVNRAGRPTSQGAAGRQSTTILPVGSREDAFRVLELVLPALGQEEFRGLVVEGLGRGSASDGYTTSPRRAAVLRWFSWRRNGFALGDAAVLLRRGAIWRELVIVPTPRMQSTSIRQGPLLRALSLAAVHIHTVAGPVSTRLGALDRTDAETLFRGAARASVLAVGVEQTDRWGSVEPGARGGGA